MALGSLSVDPSGSTRNSWRPAAALLPSASSFFHCAASASGSTEREAPAAAAAAAALSACGSPGRHTSVAMPDCR